MKNSRLIIAAILLLVACVNQRVQTGTPGNVVPAVVTPWAFATAVPVTTPPAIDMPSSLILKAFPLEVGRTWVYTATEIYAPITPITSSSAITFINRTGVVFVSYSGVITETIVDRYQTGESIIFTSTLQSTPTLLLNFDERVRTYQVVGNTVFQDNRLSLLRWPLEVDQEWDAFGDLAKDFSNVYFWHVVSREEVTVPAGHYENCFQLQLWTNPDHTINWFCPGTGIVRWEYHHHGTPGHRYWELLSTGALY